MSYLYMFFWVIVGYYARNIIKFLKRKTKSFVSPIKNYEPINISGWCYNCGKQKLAGHNINLECNTQNKMTFQMIKRKFSK